MQRSALISGCVYLLTASSLWAGGAAEQQFLTLIKSRNVKTVQAEFVCSRQLTTPDAPLVSSGTLYAAKGESARYSTAQPYRSDMILDDGKVYARTQHEKEWTKSSQSSKPGLTAVAGQMASWLVGEPRKAEEFYEVATTSAAIPAAPAGVAAFDATRAIQFELMPDNRDLKKVVESMRVALDSATRQLRFVEIRAVGGEVITYWFSPTDNAALPKDIFEPRRER